MRIITQERYASDVNEKETLHNVEYLRDAGLLDTGNRRPAMLKAFASLLEFRLIFHADDRLLQRLLMIHHTKM